MQTKKAQRGATIQTKGPGDTNQDSTEGRGSATIEEGKTEAIETHTIQSGR